MVQRIASSLLLVCAVPAAGLLQAQTISVTTTADVVDFGGGQMVVNLPGPDGKISMREACIAANKTAGAQTIGFQVPAGQWGTGISGPVIINAGQSFPIQSDDTTVDGTLQTAFTGDTNPDGAEVSFHSTVTDVQLIQSGTFAISSDRNHIIGLGNMTGRNYGLDFLPTAEENTVSTCTIDAVFAAVRVQGDRNTIGGTGLGQGNRLDSLADGLRIQGLGNNVAEDNVAVGNELTGDFNGVQIVGNATGNRIGGFAPGEANTILGAGYFQEDGTPDGAMIRIESDGNFVYGNFIGTNATGTMVADNPGDVGVEIYGDDNVVRGNVIGGITGLAGSLSIQAGISLREGAQGNTLQGNWIGVDKSGSIPLSNHLGIQISAFDSSLPDPGSNTIGGLAGGEANVIAFNEAGGVRILLSTSGNRISGNEIRDNHLLGGLGIDLDGDGSTPNDLGDGDTGPNLLMNFPSLATAVAGAQGTVLTGRLDTPSPASARLEFFSNPPGLVGEVVEAKTLLGSASPNGNGSFQLLLPGDATGLALTATATDTLGNTSEIGAPILVTPTHWADLGFGLAGTHGVPLLAGGGPLIAGTEAALVLSDALEQAPGFWVVGSPAVFLPILGGTLVPSPQAVLPFATDSGGKASLVATWPPAVPPGAKLYAQAWLVDPAGAVGVAASNGIAGTAP